MPILQGDMGKKQETTQFKPKSIVFFLLRVTQLRSGSAKIVPRCL